MQIPVAHRRSVHGYIRSNEMQVFGNSNGLYRALITAEHAAPRSRSVLASVRQDVYEDIERLISGEQPTNKYPLFVAIMKARDAASYAQSKTILKSYLKKSQPLALLEDARNYYHKTFGKDRAGTFERLVVGALRFFQDISIASYRKSLGGVIVDRSLHCDEVPQYVYPVFSYYQCECGLLVGTADEAARIWEELRQASSYERIITVLREAKTISSAWLIQSNDKSLFEQGAFLQSELLEKKLDRLEEYLAAEHVSVTESDFIQLLNGSHQ